MDDVFYLQIDEIVLSQLYISSAKLDIVLKSFKEKREDDLEPIPIKELDGELVATDGHTRLLAWYLNGYREVACVWEDVEMDWDAYRICVRWCREEGIDSIADLQDRIIDPTAYQSLWLDRCRIMQQDLEESREKR
jgi:hypothetical protein